MDEGKEDKQQPGQRSINPKEPGRKETAEGGSL